MIDFELAELFLQDSVDKQLHIEFDTGKITNEELHSENFEMNESLCSEDMLRFGCCEASSIKFKISNIFTSLKDKWLTITETLDGNTDVSFTLGKYKVNSDKPTADRRYRDIVAYDAMYDILSADVAEWYNTILPAEDSTVTLKEFRDSFLAHFGIEQEEVVLINDSMIVEKTIEPSELSGKTVITAICEINGCFGHIGRNGKFQHIFLKEMKEGLYPSDTLYPADDLYPTNPVNAEQLSKNTYISATYEDYTTAKINKLLIRQEEDDAGYPYGDGANCYVVQDNFLVYGKSTDELKTIAANLYSVICKVWYRPAHVEAKGNPCLEVGDGIKLRTTYEIIYTYILQRTLKGIQALRDTYDAEGEQYQRTDINSTHEQIIQLKGKTNRLTRTLEETRSEIIDMGKALSTRITQNAESIKLEAERASGVEGELSAQIRLNAQQILLKVSKNNIISEINQTAESITISAQKIDLVGLVEADEFVSKYATLAILSATKAELQDAIIARATIGELNVQKLRVDELETELDVVKVNYITAGTVSANYATIYSVNSVNTRIDNLLNDRMQVTGYFGLVGDFVFKNVSIEWGTLPTGQKVLMAVSDE